MPPIRFAPILLAVAALTAPSPAPAADRPSTAGPGVRVLEPMRIDALDRERTIRIYLPPGYDASTKRYPVLYMHDGQNLFDDATSYVGEWGVDEALDALAAEGLELIVVGIDHGGEKRFNELSPFAHQRFGAGENVQYTRFVVDVVKPHVDAAYRTLPDRAHTGVMGSSMGGVASHYALYAYHGVFSKAGIFSPAYWTGPAIAPWTEAAILRPGTRVYMNMGEKEGDDMVRPFGIVSALVRADLAPDAFHAAVVPGAEHNEGFWRGEFPAAVRFLFGPPPPAPTAD
jgi:predicted alpha/beta superfamily hydrolase